MHELRWTLLLLGVLFVAGLAWWEQRRNRGRAGAQPRAPERFEPAGMPARVPEDALQLPELHAREPLGPAELPILEVAPDSPLAAQFESGPADEPEQPPESWEQRESELADEVYTAETEHEPPPNLADDPDAQDDDDVGEGPEAAAEEEPEPVELPHSVGGAPIEPVVDWPPEDERHILALRIVSPGPERFAGRALRQALAGEGFMHGKFAIFHKPAGDRRACLSAASLTRPGTFDLATMDLQRYGGLSLFAVLPGPRSPADTLEELLSSARRLNERLQGALQDERGGPLTPARIAQLRESVVSEGPA